MRLTSFEVQRFRNVIDSGVVPVDPDVTCLVGKNEAGKSAMLSALHRANPAEPAPFNLGDEYPRWLLVGDRRGGDLGGVAPIRATFALDADDRAAIDGLLGPGVLATDVLSVERSYAGGVRWSAVAVDEARAVANLIERLPPQAHVPRPSTANFGALLEAARAQPEHDPAPGEGAASNGLLERAVHDLLGGRDLGEVARAALIARAPSFFYFDDYSVLPGRIDFDRLRSSAPGARDGLGAARALLRLAGADASRLTSRDYEQRRAELESVSNEITRQVFEYWSQSGELEVSIDLDTESVRTAEGRTALRHQLDLRVHDRRHGYTGNFASRSSGFRWFFSFLAAFSELSAGGRPVIVLLDEPGLGLHARAQRDFLRFINERLAPRGQVLYTTHSPFMIETDRLERVRIVEDRGPRVGSTVVADAASAQPESAAPVVAALSMQVARQLFAGPATLLVEGPAAATYLDVLSAHLRALGRQGLDEDWSLLRTSSAASIAAFATLSDTPLDVVALVDGSTAGAERLARLGRHGFMDRARVASIGETLGREGADVEDLFAAADYLMLYNASCGEGRTVSELPRGERILERLAALHGGAFDQTLPAEFLRRNRDTLLPRLSEPTLAAFERLFARLNALAAAPAGEAARDEATPASPPPAASAEPTAKSAPSPLSVPPRRPAAGAEAAPAAKPDLALEEPAAGAEHEPAAPAPERTRPVHAPAGRRRMAPSHEHPGLDEVVIKW